MKTDTVKLHIDTYRLMTTCPIYLDECEQLRSNDSILIVGLDSALISLQFANHELTKQTEADKVELKKRRKNVYKSALFSFTVGFIISIFVL